MQRNSQPYSPGSRLHLFRASNAAESYNLLDLAFYAMALVSTTGDKLVGKGAKNHEKNTRSYVTPVLFPVHLVQ